MNFPMYNSFRLIIHGWINSISLSGFLLPQCPSILHSTKRLVENEHYQFNFLIDNVNLQVLSKLLFSHTQLGQVPENVNQYQSSRKQAPRNDSTVKQTDSIVLAPHYLIFKDYNVLRKKKIHLKLYTFFVDLIRKLIVYIE